MICLSRPPLCKQDYGVPTAQQRNYIFNQILDRYTNNIVPDLEAADKQLILLQKQQQEYQDKLAKVTGALMTAVTSVRSNVSHFGTTFAAAWEDARPKV